jgi:hypothetical protein
MGGRGGKGKGEGGRGEGVGGRVKLQVVRCYSIRWPNQRMGASITFAFAFTPTTGLPKPRPSTTAPNDALKPFRLPAAGHGAKNRTPIEPTAHSHVWYGTVTVMDGRTCSLIHSYAHPLIQETNARNRKVMSYGNWAGSKQRNLRPMMPRRIPRVSNVRALDCL